ncbi:TadA family conjugal transfer-associated ATPase [Lapillicoccus jejuensis]|uniref:Pilus assembly protein CpaF n=1 Tax=Lapillicoccus jejuensis TaxID=402171 RepID=A0A542DXS5_9MICO|nr:TadA family conjugal transfer-associated ATPase [Lapillicoccus jejuensis]TQJ07879.1 pilus assembly protein CpaF [Lapillicoccus jejuensis]
MTDPSLTPGVWDRIRAGRAPDPVAIDALSGGQVARLGRDGAAELGGGLRARLLGAGALEELLERPGVTDVVVNGDGAVWVDAGRGLERAPVDLGDGEARRRLAVRLAGQAGRRLDDASPYVDGLLPSGVRLHAILPPLAEGGVHLSLRVPARGGLDLDDLVDLGTVPAAWRGPLRALVDRRVAFLVTGGTGAGKTTLLAALLSCAGPRERLVLVEDVRELAVRHPHVVRLEARRPNVEGVGEVPLRTLVRQALRMRPDRLVVGEVRGAEISELLAALNTGHDGGCGTVHANTAADVVARVEALGALAGLPVPAVHAQLVSAVQVVLHLRRGSGAGVRRLESVAVLERAPAPGGEPVVRDALTWDGRECATGPGWARLSALIGPAGGLP